MEHGAHYRGTDAKYLYDELHRLDVLVENLKRNGAVADKSL